MKIELLKYLLNFSLESFFFVAHKPLNYK